MHEDYTAAIDAVFGPQSAPQPTHDALPAEDYSAAIDSVFGPQADPQTGQPSSPQAFDAVNTRSGIAAALDAQPLETTKQPEALPQAMPEAAPSIAEGNAKPAEPEIDLADPTAGWYAPPTKQAPSPQPDGLHDDNQHFDTLAVRALMADREVLRHQLLPEGQDDTGQGALIRASFMLNNASRYKQDDVYTAITASAALGLPLDMTLDSLPKAKELLAEFTPTKIKDFAPGFLRVIQYDYDSAMLWRHDLATGNALANAFARKPLPLDWMQDENSWAKALERGLGNVGQMIAQSAVNLARLGMEGVGALLVGASESGKPTAEINAKPAPGSLADYLFSTSQEWLQGLKVLHQQQQEQQADSPLAGQRVWDNPKVLADPRWWLENTPQAIASLVPVMGGYALAGRVGGGLAGLALNGNEIYMDMLNSGLPDDANTRLYALAGGIAMSALDVLGYETLMGGRQALRNGIAENARASLEAAAKGTFGEGLAWTSKRAGLGFLAEGTTEWLQNLTMEGFKAAAQGKDVAGIVKAVGQAMTQVEDFILGGVVGGGMGHLHARGQLRGERGRQALLESIRAASQTEDLQAAREEVEAVVQDNAQAQARLTFDQSLREAVDAADNSTLRLADPDAFEREAEKLIPEDRRTLWLDLETVQDFLRDNPPVLEALGLSEQAVNDAVQTQAGSLEVSTARLLARFQGEARELLLQQARLSPDGMTLTEAKEFDPQARAEAAAERIRNRNQANAELGRERTRLKREFVAAGYAPYMAEYYATLHLEQARTFADRYGMDPVQLLRERSIVRQEQAEQGEGQAEGQQEAGQQGTLQQAAISPSMSNVRRQYEGTEQWMKAPNGQPTSLTEQEWLLVHTPEFKQWFGDWEQVAALTTSVEPDLHKSLEDAKKALLKIKGKQLVNNSTHITPVINNDQAGKLVSLWARGKSVKNGFTAQEHFAAVANIENLWAHAVQIGAHGDEKLFDSHGKPRTPDPNLQVYLFAAPIILPSGTGVAYLTVKGWQKLGERLYSLELMDIKKLTVTSSSLPNGRAASPVSFEENLKAFEEEVKKVSHRIAEHGEPLPAEIARFQQEHGQTFHQDTPTPRGSVTFDVTGASVMSIFANTADLSTPIHESAHIFLNDLIRVVMDGGRMADQLYYRDYQDVQNDKSINDALRQRRQRALTRRWKQHKNGLTLAREDLEALIQNANDQRADHALKTGLVLHEVSLDAILETRPKEIPIANRNDQLRTLQEVTAVAFEGYVREGKAPSSRLAAVFHKMRQWLLKIYKLAAIHGVRPTPDVRRVFDRMLATDAALKRSAQGKALANEGEFLDHIQEAESREAEARNARKRNADPNNAAYQEAAARAAEAANAEWSRKDRMFQSTVGPIRRLTPSPADRSRADCPSLKEGVTGKDAIGFAVRQ